jgi:hypothetical protein
MLKAGVTSIDLGDRDTGTGGVMVGNPQVNNDQLAMMLQVGLRILNLRILTLVTLVLNAVMFGWAMWAGGYDRLAVAAVFAVATWCLVHFRREQ